MMWRVSGWCQWTKRSILRRTFLPAWVLAGLIAATAAGEARMILVPQGDDPALTTPGTAVEITLLVGSTLVIDAFIENTDPIPLQGYQLTFPCAAAGGTQGSIDYVAPPVIDTSRPDFAFLGLPILPAIDLGDCPGMDPRMANTVFGFPPPEGPIVTDPKYMGEFTIEVSLDAGGDFTIDLVCLEVDGCPITSTFLRDPASKPIPVTADGMIIHVIDCTEDNECIDDLFCNGVESCVDNLCQAGTSPCTNPLEPVCDEDNDICVQCLDDPDCDDGIFCNGLETCVGNLCEPGVNEAKGTACGDGSDTDCTDPDACDGAGACMNNDAPDDAPCDDGVLCTVAEFCTAGECGGGTLNDCDDGVSCTTDTCNGQTDQCENDLDPGFCVIGGVCVSDGELNPNNDCEECDPSQGTDDWSLKPDGAACQDDDDDCTDDVCEAGACTHPLVPAGTLCDDGDPCTGTGAPGVGDDECDAKGICAGELDPNCADDCTNAIEVFDGANFGNNEGLGPDDAEALCQPNSNNDFWFKYTATCDGAVLINTHGSLFEPSNDTVLSVYDACGGKEIACDDDGGIGLLSALEIDATAGITYFIRVAGFGNNTGDIVLNILRVDTCLIEDVCYATGEIDTNLCRVCNPDLSNTAWSPVQKGTSCGDPSFGECDSPDACDGAGECELNHKPDGTPCIDDGNECTEDFCVTGVCEHPDLPAETPCGDPTDTECDNPDTCDGAGTCEDRFEPFGFACNDPADTDCDDPDTCDGGGVCLDNLEDDGTACTDDGNQCTDDVCQAGLCDHPNEPDGTICDDADVCTENDMCITGSCDGTFVPEAPLVEALGSRVIAVTPQPVGGSPLVALRVTSPNDWPCVLKYVQLDGSLDVNPVSQSADDWGTINVSGLDIVPVSEYYVEAECGTGLSDPGIDTTWVWADVNNDGIVDLDDILCVTAAFGGDFTLCTLEAMDIAPCEPNGFIDLDDILMVVAAFGGAAYPCDLPCPPPPGLPAGTPGPILGVSRGFAPASITLVASLELVQTGDRFAVEIYGDDLLDLHAYQITVQPIGPNAAHVAVESMFIDTDRPDYVFASRFAIEALNPSGRRLANVLVDGGVDGSGRMYLGTFVFRVSPAAQGTIHVRASALGTLLRDSENRGIDAETSSYAEVRVQRTDPRVNR